MLIDEGDYNGSNEPGNNHETFNIHTTQALHSIRNQSLLNNNSEQSPESITMNLSNPQEDDQRQNTNNQVGKPSQECIINKVGNSTLPLKVLMTIPLIRVPKAPNCARF